MSVTPSLRILAVALLGWVVAHTVWVLLKHVAGQERLAVRDVFGEALTGLGALAIGWGLLPGGPATGDDLLFAGGILVWIVGGLLQPVKRTTPVP